MDNDERINALQERVKNLESRLAGLRLDILMLAMVFGALLTYLFLSMDDISDLLNRMFW